MILQFKSLSGGYHIGLVGVAIIVYLLVMYFLMWHPMDQSIEVLQQDVARLHQENHILIPKINSRKAIENDVSELRENLASRIKHFSTIMESKAFRRDVIEIAKHQKVLIRIWKPEIPLGLPHSETSIPITIRLEGNFHNTVQFLDELRQLQWVQRIASLNMDRSQEDENSSLLITNMAIYGLTALGIEEIQSLLNA